MQSMTAFKMTSHTISLVVFICGLMFWSPAAAQSLPTVDLGYQVQRASSFNTTGQYYNFSNIRYAQPPLGELRWAAPLAPSGRNETVNDGTQYGPICPQATPSWSPTGSAFTSAFVRGQLETFDFNATASQPNASVVPPIDPRTNEDCLFLDIFAPKAVFDSVNSMKRHRNGAPVLVWIYGGGYTAGYKSSGNPSGLIEASQVDDSDGIIFVALNYRLGAFGWLSGPTFSTNGTQNVALYDQRLALEWVKEHIGKFGGDPERVTLIGESAGGGSIMHQVTAYGGERPVPFQQAILQSAAWLPVPSSWKQEQTFEGFLNLLNVSTLEEARKLPSSQLIQANRAQVGASNYGSFTYGPTVGGAFVPELPGKLLLRGAFAQDLTLMVGHNTYEGVFFTDPRTKDETYEISYLRTSFPGIQNSVITYLLNDLYPRIYNSTDPTIPYTTPTQRAIFSVTEGIFTCNTVYLSRAFLNNTYAYQFSVPPSIHGQDVSYTFWNGASQSGGLPINATVARVMQELFTSFAAKGEPSSETWGGEFGTYTNLDRELDLNVTGISLETDDTANRRCEWWQKALYS